MKKFWVYGMIFAMFCVNITGCGSQKQEEYKDATQIVLSDKEITVDGVPTSSDSENAVYTARDIVFYLEGQDFIYGEGTKEDEHSQEEADRHTVVHITKPGDYVVSGTLSLGQIAVDLGEDAKEDPEAVVTLILNGVDITSTVAPAVIFYNVYECSVSDAEDASKDVDTAAAGANVIIADGSVNNVSGSYVARIYKSVELNEAGTEVTDSKKLHKYDGAFYSKMSMNVDGGSNNTGILNIKAENEGLDTELHLTINGGNIYIESGNDGINTNEDEVSVTTINGGTLDINVAGTTGEGDGIDSNGWIVINGGVVSVAACGNSMDSGLDADMGIYLNGGIVTASGNMFDEIAESKQNYAVFSFSNSQKGGSSYTLKNEKSEVVLEVVPKNDFSILVVSLEKLADGTYTFWQGQTQLAAAKGDMAGGMFGGFPGGGGRPGGFEMLEGMTPPEGFEMPEGMTPPEGFKVPGGMGQPGFNFEDAEKVDPGMMQEMPEVMEQPGKDFGRGPGGMMNDVEVTTEFVITAGANYFSNVSKSE